MRIFFPVAGMTALLLLTYPASSYQIGPRIVVGGGKACVGDACVSKHGVTLPTLDQLIDNAINGSPLQLLSDADKKNVREAIKTTGFVSAIAADPVTGIVILTVLSPKGEKTDVPVPTVDAPPTGKTWSFKARCLVQQEGGLVTAMFNDDPEHMMEIKLGDTLILTAGYCVEYKQKSVTAVTIKFSGRTDYADSQPPIYRHYLVGKGI
jgi:hypothetical protein